MQTAEQIIETVRTLPKVEREKFFDWAEGERRKFLAEDISKKSASQNEREKFQRAMKWIDENRQRYLGEWVCLDGDQLVAHGTDAVKLYREAKEKGVEIPFIEHIVEENKSYGGGIESCP